MIKHQILLVEDDHLLAEAIKRILEHASRFSSVNYEVAIAGNGNLALTLWRERIFDLMIVDLVMPGKSGGEVIEQVKEANPFLPVIILTGEGKIEDAIAAVNRHVFAYLKKPVDQHVLLEKVQEALKSRQHGLQFMEKLADRHPDVVLMHEAGKNYTAMDLYQEMRRGSRQGMQFGEGIQEGLDRLDIQLSELSLDELLGLKES